MAIVVSDTSPVRALAHLQRLDLLTALFGEVLIPPTVAEELTHPVGRFAPFDVHRSTILKIQSPRDRNRVEVFRRELQAGESEALALAIEVNAWAVLMDEAAGRAAALRVGLRPMRVVGILLLAKEQGLTTAVVPLLDRLVREFSFFLTRELREHAAKLAMEPFTEEP